MTLRSSEVPTCFKNADLQVEERAAVLLSLLAAAGWEFKEGGEVANILVFGKSFTVLDALESNLNARAKDAF